jgi:N-methylhydantoinase A
MARRFRLGIDVGGTFTDFAVMDESTGQLVAFKVATTPQSPAQAVVTGIRRLTERQLLDPAGLEFFVHGTTLATNTVIQRRGAKVGLLVTEGFRDVMSIARQRLANPFDFTTRQQDALVRRRHTLEVTERVLADGSVVVPIDEAQLGDQIERLRHEEVEAIAIAFMHAYKNPAHERAAKQQAIDLCPDTYVCASAELWPQIREYERTLVTVMNAYVGRTLDAYFGVLLRELRDVGVSTRVFVTKSNGGIMTAEGARQAPVQLMLSGPAAGVVGATHLAKLAGWPKIITLDIGGTSADLSIADGEPLYSSDGRVGEFPVTLPAVDVSSIGAGGGSIAWTDAVGVLKIGPDSAGADPGPACYGLGGTAPTVTDAYVVLGLVDPARFLGGSMTLRPDLAAASMERIAAALQRSREEAAEAIVQVATAAMYRELMSVLARRGIEPADYALFVFGGAGATHGFLLAQEADIKRVLVPPTPGILCALGALVADVKNDFIRTVYLETDGHGVADTCARLQSGFDALGAEALAWLDAEGLAELPYEIRRSADIRYVGQSFEVDVPVEAADLTDASGVTAIVSRFHDLHARIYGYAERDGAVEVINIRTTIIGRTTKPAVPELPPGSGSPEFTERKIFCGGRAISARVVARADLPRGFEADGPMIVEQYDTTTFVPPGWRLSVDRYGNLLGVRNA